ncbi:MAG: hypothetical protein F7B17_08130 [Desulfurococcales archaeon]|nr:hypothetical protein [Desulfurococcales archaeon]
MGRERVEAWIREKGLGWRLITMPGPTRTVAEAASQLDVDASLIVKTLVLVCEGGVYAAIIPGDRRLSLDKVARIAGECRLARRGEVVGLTGYPAGGVPPVALPEGVRVIVDSRVASMSVAYGGGGDEMTLLEFKPGELLETVESIVADVSE